jgi:hypothetical protein
MNTPFQPSPLGKIGQALFLAALISLLCLAATGPAFAELPPELPPELPAVVDEVGTCVSCHPAEYEHWLNSTHAFVPSDSGEPYASCESCHGEYVYGHPQNGVVQIRVDSSMCSDCHAETVEQWEGTIHAEANVQCISCHMAHSQDLRLTDDRLCQSCHTGPKEDSFHTVHWYNDVSCTTCHMSPNRLMGVMVMNGDGIADLGSLINPTHDFTAVSSAQCLDCHRESVFNPDQRSGSREVMITELRKEQNRSAELTARLHDARKTTQNWQIMTPVSLGMGVGIGGVLGIAFMLFLARYMRKEGE